ncbi:PD-(D/E)XK nuclease family protein [Halorussus litoreus]|uniref:PD-(D/E)XK nuclease family protein n=1 Tax=Halorussus litoreus TaxID=1710536 RepID=UPI000E220FB5|nr:PD-(D/E)XK nuclease family protein [Halorussus litoreus]
MSIRRAKSVDSLYEDCEDYDLVVVPEAPLARALNRRLDEPRLGAFAATPRRLAVSRETRPDDRQLFLEVVDRTELGWKRASHLVSAVLNCWEKSGDVEAILGYDRFDDEATRTVVDIAKRTETRHRRLAEYSVEDDQSIAVVGPEFFTELELSVLPDEYDEISPFAEDAFDRPPFHVFDSTAAIVDTLLDTVSAENAEDVAVVMNQGGTFPALVESALEAEDVPFHGGPGFADESFHRLFVQSLRAGFAGSDLRVKDVKPILAELDESPSIDHDEKRLSAVDLREVDWLDSFCDSLDDCTFRTALEQFEQRADSPLTRFEEELETLSIADEPVTETAVDELAFYLQSYDVPVDREDEGVLLAAAKSSAYVDRPVVFYLGLDQDWTYSPPVWPWVDEESEFERHLDQFQLLIQNGVDQYYLVRDEAGGSPVTPCLYFEELLDEEFDRFRDLDSIPHGHVRYATEDGFQREPRDVEPESVETISQSSLNTYANCPRDYFFSRIVDSPDQDYFREGNLFHDFAEFYVHHPEFVDGETINDVVEAMLDEMSQFVGDVDRPVLETKYRIGIQNVVEYLDENPPDVDSFVTPDGGRWTNTFADHFDRSVDSDATERWFENDHLGLKGKIDLVHGPNRLLDYKSGSKKSAYSIVKHSSFDPMTDEPNFQALLYLAHRRSERPGERLEFTFFHFFETLDEVVAGEADVEDTLTKVTYFPMPFDEYVASRDAFEKLCDGYKDCRQTFEDLGYERYREIMQRHSFPDTTDKSELRESAFSEAFAVDVAAAVSEDVDAEKGCDQAIRELNGVRKRNFFEEEVDAFEEFVDERLDELNRYRAGDARFPVGEPNFDRVDNRDLVLTDDD